MVLHPSGIKFSKFNKSSSSKWVSAALSAYRRVIEGFAFARLLDTHLPQILPGTFHPTLTTTALYRSSSDWFGTRAVQFPEL